GSSVQSSRPPAPQKILRPARKYRESLRQPVFVIEQFAMLDVWTLDGLRRPFGDGHHFRQTMGFRILDVETRDRSPILENPLQFYHSRKIGSSRFSRSCQPQVSERTSGNCVLVSRQGFTDSRREQPT